MSEPGWQETEAVFNLRIDRGPRTDAKAADLAHWIQIRHLPAGVLLERITVDLGDAACVRVTARYRQTVAVRDVVADDHAAWEAAERKRRAAREVPARPTIVAEPTAPRPTSLRERLAAKRREERAHG